MSIDWENILPEKWSTDEPHCDAFNRCRYESLNALKAAETRGEICKPLSVSDIEDILDNQLNMETRDTDAYISGKDNAAHLIRNAMLNKEG